MAEGYKIIDSDELRAAMNALVDDIASVLVRASIGSCHAMAVSTRCGCWLAYTLTNIHTCTLVLRIQINQAIHPFAAAALLRHCSWNKEQVIDSFCTDMDKVSDERNGSTDGRTEQDWMFLTHPTTHQAKEAAGIARFVLELQPGSKAQVCGICREEVAASKLVAIGCGHSFCRPCYTAYLCSKVRRCDAMQGMTSPGSPVRPACPACLPACLSICHATLTHSSVCMNTPWYRWTRAWGAR